MKQANIIWLWRGILLISSIALLLWLFYQNLVPTGVLVLHYKKGSPASLISDLHPAKRVIETMDDNQTFYIDPIYFDVKVPRQFDKIIVDIAWQNQAQPILELGARKVRGEFGFVLEPLQNKIIDNINLDTRAPHPNPLPKGEGTNPWSCQREAEVLFCQKVKKYNNLESFLANPVGKLSTYHYKPSVEIKYDAMNVETDINKYDYLIANYTPPRALGNDWYQREVEYDWKDFDVYINEISFLLSAPQLNLGHGQITAGDITVTLRRPPLDWPGFVEYIKNQLRRLLK